MILKKETILLALLLGTQVGCNNGKTGTWVMTYDADPVSTYSGETIHNYIDDDVPGESDYESEWVYEASSESSPGLEAISFLFYGRNTAYLVFDGELFPGEKDEDRWVFQWSSEDSDYASEKHETGYIFSESNTFNVTTIVDVTFTGSTFEGTYSRDYFDSVSWVESDLWDEYETGVYGGQTPAYYYLESGVPFDSASNDPSSADCSATDCELTRNVSYSHTWGISGTFVGNEGDFTYEDLYNSDQPAGDYYLD